MGEALSKSAMDAQEELEILKCFIEEAIANLEQAEDLALKLEANPSDMETINKLFGIVHTVKGGSGFFEPKTLNRFAHKFEEILKKIQKKEIVATDEVVSSILKGLDILRVLTGEFKSGEHKVYTVENLIQEVFTYGEPGAPPPAKEAEPVVARDASDTKAAVAPLQGAQEKSAPELKVAVSLLDEFMQTSGEMTVIRNMLNKCVKSIERQYPGDKDVTMLAELLDELHKINGSVQSNITELRKVPMKSILKAIPRAVRDVAKTLAKEVDLVLHGEELRVDTAVGEALSNSMIHIVRNSVDHGLELPIDRLKAGKPSKGKVQITSSIRNENVVIEIEDDGRGINEDAIRKRLIKIGTHTQAEANALVANDLYKMIFEAGFSTAEKVTDISGRGVGMSMVKSSVEAVGGNIQIESRPQKGSKFILTLPVPKSVLIIDCLFVTSNKMQFGIPQDDLIRVLRVDASNRDEFVFSVEGSWTLKLENELIPIAWLDDILKLNQGEEKHLTSSPIPEEMHLLIIASGIGNAKRKLALAVDQVLDVEDTVIKPVLEIIRRNGLFQGATFLDDGTVGLVLKSEGILDRVGISSKIYSKNASAQSVMAAEAAERVPTQDILLFEMQRPGLYSVPRKNIFRIEEILPDKIQMSGGFPVMSYRDHILTLVDLESDLFGSKAKDGNTGDRRSDKLTAMVVEHGQGFVGFIVQRILDIGEVQGDPLPPMTQQLGILGTYIVGKRTVTALDLEHLVRFTQEKR